MAESASLIPLVQAGELLQLGAAPNLRILDCRHELTRPGWGAAAYAEGHIPGAAFVSLDRELAAPVRPGTGRHPLPAPADFARVLGRWGILPGTRVVAYDHGPGAWAARLWWMLRSVGHGAVQVLDGGLPAWIAAGGAVEAAVPAIAPTVVPPREFTGTIETAEVQAELGAGRITLVDARGADRFAGQNETIDPVPGHVPGAINHPFTAQSRRCAPLSACRRAGPALADGIAARRPRAARGDVWIGRHRLPQSARTGTGRPPRCAPVCRQLQ